MEKKKEQVFDISLFKRLLVYIKPYKLVFVGVLVAVILIALLGRFDPKYCKWPLMKIWQTKTWKAFYLMC